MNYTQKYNAYKPRWRLRGSRELFALSAERAFFYCRSGRSIERDSCRAIRVRGPSR